MTVGEDTLLAGTNAGDVEKLVPADALLLAGTCIVDEAVLTGESTPQWKSAIGTPEEDDLAAPGQGQEKRLSIKRDKNHVLFSGTKLLQHTGDKQAHIKTPDGACLAVVLRTGFETSQGMLLHFSRTSLVPSPCRPISQVKHSMVMLAMHGIPQLIII